MAIDLNDAPRYGRFDLDVVSATLRLHADKWVPFVFPNGRREYEGGEQCWRCANIKGDRPGEHGSCRIWLTGEHAGDWYDFEKNHGGQTLSTIKEHFNLAEGEAVGKAVEIIEQCGIEIDAGKVYTNGHAKLNGDARADRNATTAMNYWLNSSSCVGTITEIYWQKRALGDLPPCAFGSYDGTPDMQFHPFASNWDLGGKGVPTIVHRFRFPDYTLTGAVHLTHLRDDGSYHLGKGIGKKTWGPRINGGLVMLAPINLAGELGIGEGIESTAAGSILFPGVPGWATCGTAAMRKFGEWFAAADPAAIAPIKRLLLWGDAGKGGERTLFETAALCRSRLAAVECYLPRSGDDMAADLAQGLGQPAQALDAAPALPMGPQPAAIVAGSPAAEIASRLMALGKLSPPADVSALCALIAGAGLPDIERESAINNIYRKTGISKRTVAETIRGLNATAVSNNIIAFPTQSKPPRHWLDKLAMGNDGEPKGIMSNVATVLRQADEIKGAFAQNDFTGMIHVLRKLPWEPGAGNPCEDRWMNDTDELGTLEWIQGTAGIHATRGATFDAIQRVASEYTYHPVREYLHDAHERWDRRARLDMLSVLYFGAKNTEYNREVMKRWIISAVARVLNPGVKADCMTVLEGAQGLGKSTALRILFDPNNSAWFTDQLAEMGSKDSSLELRGIWCAEYSDLKGMNNTESRTIKSYMSRTFDRFRPPYGRFMIRVERQNVFGATTNDNEYLKDETGARRFWPLRCTLIDRDGLIRDKDQIWGEAVDMYLNHHNTWWIDETREPVLAAEAARVTDARYINDAWDAVVRRWLQNNARINVTADEVLRDALEISDKSRWSKNDQTRIGYIMRRMKWTRARDRLAPREWRYWRPGTLNPAIAEAEED